ncbi:hypothetical protein [Actinoplanes teichomyceticus]|uniref:Phage integrase family protein n=1 Tax=Actinoplanes teichomyceticus TaxID=1867 RepID=A0A561VLV8_ACTTI|nr:phage integrase family protein [Actinoplanes teichomyceticus]GIF13971.1 hypothetical protein Ate01nite_40030 [Actinoplanes teichomyceticus]
MLFYCGARVEECARLDTGDRVVTERTGTLRLHGKGDELRTVPVPQEARKALRAWPDDRGREPGPHRRPPHIEHKPRWGHRLSRHATW